MTLGTDEVYFRSSNPTGLQTMATVRWFMPDANNNTMMLTDGASTLQQLYGHEPCGRVKKYAITADDNTQQYTGRENDGSGLYYYRNRYYMPTCARFISEDPIGWASGQTNNYAYVGGNPVQFADPNGEFSPGLWTLIAAGVAIYKTADLINGFADNVFAGREAACNQKTIDLWKNWNNQTMSKPPTQWSPSDFYVAAHFNQQIYPAVASQVRTVAESYAGGVNPTGIGPEAAAGVAQSGLGLEIGLAWGCPN